MKAAAVFLLAAVGYAVSGIAQESDAGARQLTVELFSTRRIASVTMIPLGQSETLRSCAGCRPRALKKALTATVHGDAIDLGSGPPMRVVMLEGAFRVKPDADAKPIGAAGVWTLTVVQGAIRVRLVLDSERYVALALHGEAAAQEPLESMKAMAIAVRTFALENANRHHGQGFNLCDSTHCQALKFGTPSPLVDQAVRETAGETLWFGTRRALVFYTQNCGGQSEDARQAWPGTVAPYLRAHADPYCTRRGAAAWRADIPVDQLVRVAQTAGWKLPKRIDAVHVVKRTDAGRVLRLSFAGDEANVLVTASSLRFALNRALGWNQLRSDWYTVTLRGGVLHFDGRGYGHGVGLCQAGATQMAKEGKSAAEILSFYFPDTKLGLTADGGVWQSAHEAGWTLWTTGSSTSLAQEGDAAWGRARALYPPEAQPVEPAVWAMPTTELFRQMAHQPGWMLASAQGTRVLLQPETVVSKSGGENETLLHEFLHVLVESETSEQTPLWLREGIVETLAGDREQDPGRRADPRVVDAGLVQPASQADSQKMHAEAAKLARTLIAQDGLAQVRTWVRSGSLPAEAIRTLGLPPGSAAAQSQPPSTQP